MSITKETVQATPTFNRLDPLQQKLILKKDSFERIRNGVCVAKHKGLQLYKTDHNPTERELNIITELLLNNG